MLSIVKIQGSIQGIVYSRFKMGLQCTFDVQDIFLIESRLMLALPQKIFRSVFCDSSQSIRLVYDVRDIVLTCVVLHNMLRSHQGGADRPPTPADDIQLPQGDQGEQRHHENLRNPSREAKYQQDLLKGYFNHLGALAGLEDRTEFKKTEGRTYCHLSVLFRTTQIIQELLFSNVLPPKNNPNFQTI